MASFGETGTHQFSFALPPATPSRPWESPSSYQQQYLPPPRQCDSPGLPPPGQGLRHLRPHTPHSYASAQTSPSATNHTNPQHTRGSEAPQQPRSSLVVPPEVVDGLAKDCRLNNEERNNPHLLNEACSDPDSNMSRAQVYVSLLLLAQISEVKQGQMLLASQSSGEGTSVAAVLTEINKRMEASFTVSTDQRTNVRAVCADLLYEPTRTNFKLVYVDVMDVLRAEKGNLDMENIFGNPAREAQLLQVTKTIATSVRSRLQRDLQKSIKPAKFMSLDKFTYTAGNVNIRSGPNKISKMADPAYKYHNALMRYFTFYHPPAANEPENHNDDDDDDDDETTTPPPPKHKKTQEKTRKTGHMPEAEDFWLQMDNWFAELVQERGPDLKASEWGRYLNNLVQLDDHRFIGAPSQLSTSTPPQSTTFSANHNHGAQPARTPLSQAFPAAVSSSAHRRSFAGLGSFSSTQAVGAGPGPSMN